MSLLDSQTFATFRLKIAGGDVTKVAITKNNKICLILHTRYKIHAKERSQSLVASCTLVPLRSYSQRPLGGV